MSQNQEELLAKMNTSSSLTEIQLYVKEVLKIRGFSNQTAQDKVLLLIEEIGELAKAIRQSATKISIDYDRIQNYDTVESEVADVLIVLLSLCNVLDINAYKAFMEKEMTNTKREWKKRH